MFSFESQAITCYTLGTCNLSAPPEAQQLFQTCTQLEEQIVKVQNIILLFEERIRNLEQQRIFQQQRTSSRSNSVNSLDQDQQQQNHTVSTANHKSSHNNSNKPASPAKSNIPQKQHLEGSPVPTPHQQSSNNKRSFQSDTESGINDTINVHEKPKVTKRARS
eukprot:c10186_g1_i2.p1 GENE.c10186_g1_i2~~c10186_g1_i2.p1  ORF type:complete len:163 (-),score=47.65 c10186_g1_i2:148-636(-)